MTNISPLRRLVADQRRAQGLALALALVAAIAVAAASVLLLGVSGWFITAAAVAGAGGAAAVMAFNYLVPSAAIRGLTILRTVGRYGERYYAHAAAMRALAALRAALFRAVAAAPPEQVLALPRGEASSHLVQDIGAIETEFVAASAPPASLVALGVGVVLVSCAGPAPAAALAALMAASVAVSAGLAHRFGHPRGEAVLQAFGAYKAAVHARQAAIVELACYGALELAAQPVAAAEADLARAKRELAEIDAASAAAQAFFAVLAAIVVVALAAKGALAVAALAGFGALAAMDGAGVLARRFERSGEYRGALRRLEAWFQIEHAPRAPPPAATSAVLEIRQGKDWASLEPPARARIVGRSGVGKTVLVETLIGLRADDLERVRIAGAPARSLPLDQVRRLFAWSPQDTALISGTVRENLTLGRPDASDAELWQALEDAVLAAKVRSLPDWLDAWVGEGGARLSGGERRRLSLARALLRRVPWLVLDEPVEGLDPPTARQLVAALEARLQCTGQGLILVSHREEPAILCSGGLSLGIEAAE